jgi:hypothetical protein
MQTKTKNTTQPCDYCDQIEQMTARRHCPIHFEQVRLQQNVPETHGDPEYQSRIEAERLTWQLKLKSDRRLDSGKVPITESPLFGGSTQSDLFSDVNCADCGHPASSHFGGLFACADGACRCEWVINDGCSGEPGK